MCTHTSNTHLCSNNLKSEFCIRWPFNWEYSTALLCGRLCITVEDIGPDISIKLTVSQVKIKHCLLIKRPRQSDIWLGRYSFDRTRQKCMCSCVRSCGTLSSHVIGWPSLHFSVFQILFSSRMWLVDRTLALFNFLKTKPRNVGWASKYAQIYVYFGLAVKCI